MIEPSEWKTPDEIMRLQLLQKKTSALQARIVCPAELKVNHRVVQKRKNPFVDKRESTNLKIPRLTQNDNTPADVQFLNENSIFNLLAQKSTSTTTNSQWDETNVLNNCQSVPQSFASLILAETGTRLETSDIREQKSSNHIPFDWSLKSKIRFLTLTSISGTILKSSQEASGITSFVRCLNPTASPASLDLSPGARFHQATMFWQHPHLPWLTLFPRNSTKNDQVLMGELERKALFKDWSESFRSLFQLLRSRQCPFFYVCTNSFIALFRAAGVGGRTEIHSLLSPTSRGLRSTLQQEEIEFSLPLRDDKYEFNNGNPQRKSLDTATETCNLHCPDLIDSDNNASKIPNDQGHEDDQEKWLASLGVEVSEIQKINTIHARTLRNIECLEDFSDHSIALIEGIECQAFFNFLLHSKSSITSTGRLAGVPPTLLAPVAFPGATLRNLQTKTSKINVENNEYLSTEIRGVILPHILPYLCNLLSETKDSFSASMSNYPKTVPFSKASQKLLEVENKGKSDKSTSDHVFGQANLSDCGLPPNIIELLCKCTKDSVRILERICFNKSVGYTWN